ncbi:hypothetical protein GCM10029964_081850 [Kibdelosporangium lantanae]
MVWRGTDTELGREVALKRSQVGDHGQIRREARVGAGLLHQNVITVFDTVTDGGERWLVMEYLPSRSLEQILETGKPLAEPEVVKIGVQVASALTAMHERGMVHRDIKPGNILVTDDGVAKLTDLGIARWAEVTRTGGAQIAGTLGYLAPEVADGHEATAASDVFSSEPPCSRRWRDVHPGVPVRTARSSRCGGPRPGISNRCDEPTSSRRS